MATQIELENDIKMLKIEAEGTTNKKEKAAIKKKITAAAQKLVVFKAEQVPVSTPRQAITDFTTEFVKAKVSGLSIQGKASRRLKGLSGALLTRQWVQDSKNALKFTTTKKGRKFQVKMDVNGQAAVLTTKGKAVQFPLGKGAFRSVDYILSAYGFRYMSATQNYEEGHSVV